MGQGGSRGQSTNSSHVDRAGLEEEEYQQLLAHLEVAEDSLQAHVSLPAFLARFQAHLRPLVQPLFFHLARLPVARMEAQSTATKTPSAGSASSPSSRHRTSFSDSPKSPDSGTFSGNEIAEPAASWPVFIARTAEIMNQGASWPALLGAWVGEGGSAADPSLASRCEAGAELAAALCFWCAHPSLAPDPGAPGGMPTSAAAAVAAGSDVPTPLDTLLAVLRPCATAALAAAGEKDAAAAVAARLSAFVPSLTCGVGPRLQQALLGIQPMPDCPLPESRILGAGLSFVLRGISSQLWASGAWDPLYRDWCDGRSFNGLLKGTLHYPGNAILVVRGTSGQIVGAVSNCWEEGNGKYSGGAECCLFALKPELKVFRTTGKSENFGYVNSRNKHAPRGLGFGGQAGCFRLGIDADFEECQVLESDATYQNGGLLPGSEYQISFKISHIEVWGCSGCSALASQHEGQDGANSVRNKARQVDRARMVENEFDKEMFFGKTFGQGEGAERADT